MAMASFQGSKNRQFNSPVYEFQSFNSAKRLHSFSLSLDYPEELESSDFAKILITCPVSLPKGLPSSVQVLFLLQLAGYTLHFESIFCTQSYIALSLSLISFWERRLVGYIFQNFGLQHLKHPTVFENKITNRFAHGAEIVMEDMELRVLQLELRIDLYSGKIIYSMF